MSIIVTHKSYVILRHICVAEFTGHTQTHSASTTQLSREGKSSWTFPSQIQENLHILYILSGVDVAVRRRSIYRNNNLTCSLRLPNMHTEEDGEGGGAHGNRNPLHKQIDGHCVKYVTSGDRREY